MLINLSIIYCISDCMLIHLSIIYCISKSMLITLSTRIEFLILSVISPRLPSQLLLGSILFLTNVSLLPNLLPYLVGQDCI